MPTPSRWRAPRPSPAQECARQQQAGRKDGKQGAVPDTAPVTVDQAVRWTESQKCDDGWKEQTDEREHQRGGNAEPVEFERKRRGHGEEKGRGGMLIAAPDRASSVRRPTRAVTSAMPKQMELNTAEPAPWFSPSDPSRKLFKGIQWHRATEEGALVGVTAHVSQ